MEELKSMRCGGCGIVYAVPDFWLADKKSSGKNFYCPNGCLRTFGETDADRLRRERDRLQQRVAQKDDEIERQRDLRELAERSAKAYKGHLTRTKRRVGNGVCPCCNRTFKNLAEHMKHQHPNYSDEVPAQAVE